MFHEEGEREHTCEQGGIRKQETIYNAEIDGDRERLHAVRNSH